MIIVNRTEFLKLPANTLYVKYANYAMFGNLEIKANGPEDGYSNDWVTNIFFSLIGSELTYEDYNPGDTFRFEEDQTSRDALFDSEQLFAVFDNTDIEQLIGKISKCIK